MAISKRLRYEVLRRDNHACRYCGIAAPQVVLTVDHVIPVTLGGSDEPSNLVAACRDCNTGKSASSPDAELVANVAEDAMRWRKAMEVAERMGREERQATRVYIDYFLDDWRQWSYDVPSYKSGTGKNETKYFPLPANWELRIAELVAAGATMEDITDAVNAAMGGKYVKDEFAYFVGVVRQKLATRQSVARELIRKGVV